MYVEQKTANGSTLGDRGPAEIGEISFSKTGTTIYYKDKSFRKASAIGRRGFGLGYNYVCVETGDGYWISGVKKRGTNRHWAGGGAVSIGEAGCTAEAKGREKDQLFEQIRAGLEAAAQNFLQMVYDENPALKLRVFLFDIHEYRTSRNVSSEVFGEDWRQRGDYVVLEDVNERLLKEAYGLSFLKPFDGGLRQLCLEALRSLDSAGVFGTEAQRQLIVIGVDNPFVSCPQISEQAFFACAKLLNPPQAIQRLRRELKQRKQAK